MDFIRTLRLAAWAAGLSWAAASCISPPDYPDTPSIEFKEMKVQRVDSTTGVFDRVIITVSFKDGDGDLGLSPTDTLAPYNEFTDRATRTRNLDHFNYFIQPQIKQGNRFVDFVNPPPGFRGEYNSRFPRLEPNADKEAPLRGDLNFKQTFYLGAEFQPGDEVRFVISIKDRALNQSNTVTTSSFVVQ